MCERCGIDCEGRAEAGGATMVPVLEYGGENPRPVTGCPLYVAPAEDEPGGVYLVALGAGLPHLDILLTAHQAESLAAAIQRAGRWSAAEWRKAGKEATR